MASKISVVINTLNEEKNIARAISSVKSLADEIIVVDMESMDKTKEIAEKLGAKVCSHQKTGYVEPARNFAISKAANDWVFILDADEEIGPELVKEIKGVINKPKADYYRIPRKNIIFGKWMEHTLWWPDYQIRLFKKGSVSWSEVIHSVPLTAGKGVEISQKENLAVLHHNYDSLDQYLERLNRYTTVQSNLLVKDNYKFTWTDVITKPFKEFVNRYFTGEGYKDGLHGLALSLLQAFSELTVYLKVWQSQKFTEQNLKPDDVVNLLRDSERDLHYWESDTLYKESGNLKDRIRRKLKI